MANKRTISRLFLCLFFFAGSVAIIELGFRGYFALKVGPDALFYGILPSRQELHRKATQTVMYHENAREGYSKYFPHQKRIDYDRETGETFDVGINGSGFRGEKFAEKAPGTIRVVSLGASSTFGYGSRDNETWPVYLEELLNDACERPVEVLNLGMPHLDSGGVRALFTHEALPLEPDVVTYYQGANDTVAPLELGGPLLRWGWKHFLFVKFLDVKLRPPPKGLDFEAARARYLGNVEEIASEALGSGALLVVGNQQAKSGRFRRMKGITYQDEIATIQRDIRKNGASPAANLLYHWRLMGDLERWAMNNKTPFVDVITALDQDRDTLISWVHLSPRGNRLVAQAFAKVIRQHVCGEGGPCCTARAVVGQSDLTLPYAIQ